MCDIYVDVERTFAAMDVGQADAARKKTFDLAKCQTVTFEAHRAPTEDEAAPHPAISIKGGVTALPEGGLLTL